MADGAADPSRDTRGGDGVREARAMIRDMRPALAEGRFAYRAVAPREAASVLEEAEAMVREPEGVCAILPATAGDRPVLRRITLSVHSSLEGVGLTAAVATALAETGVACNMVAGLHHDHVYVPEADAERALDALKRLAAAAA